MKFSDLNKAPYRKYIVWLPIVLFVVSAIPLLLNYRPVWLVIVNIAASVLIGGWTLVLQWLDGLHPEHEPERAQKKELGEDQ